MKYNLEKIQKKLESNVIPRSMRRMNLGKAQAKTMASLTYEVVYAAAPRVNRPDFIKTVFADAVHG